MFFRLGRLVRAAGRDIVVLWYACRNPRTPALVKLISIVLALYLISPVDLLPDTLPILGWLDDATLLALTIPALLKLAPQAALQDAHEAADRLLSRWAFWRHRS